MYMEVFEVKVSDTWGMLDKYWSNIEVHVESNNKLLQKYWNLSNVNECAISTKLYGDFPSKSIRHMRNIRQILE